MSNNGARVRWLIYKCGLEDKVEIASPQALGGFKSEQHLALSPTGKLPLLVLPSGTALPESEVLQLLRAGLAETVRSDRARVQICLDYLLDKFQEQTRALVPKTPEERALARVAPRLLDVYITPIQVPSCCCRLASSGRQQL